MEWDGWCTGFACVLHGSFPCEVDAVGFFRECEFDGDLGECEVTFGSTEEGQCLLCGDGV